MADQLDMENRDPNSINDHIKIAFEDTIAEVPGAHAIDCVWRNSYRCFEGGKSCCYKFLTAICGICIALYWGCCFACLAFEHIWCVTPSLSAFRIECGAWRNKTNNSKHQLRENEDRQTQKTHYADSPTLCEGMQLVGNKQVLQSPTQFPYTRNVVNVLIIERTRMYKYPCPLVFVVFVVPLSQYYTQHAFATTTKVHDIAG
ncbi:hypothetical protein AM593_00717, partial [Mytilus galloprovincialis]